MTEDDELSIAQPDDFFVTRDDDDELQPVTQPLPGVQEHIRVVPMTMGDINEYGGSDERLNPNQLSTEDIAEIINEHWYDAREKDDFEVTPEMVEEDMVAFGADPLLRAILEASGYSMQNALNMENLEMLEQIDDPGKLETMMELAESRS
ncbi:hypothetical protein G6M89_09280 [Natronolimnobius sp. AArcel1]|uniref:hypothetical protein n=1 Tax=Natronolimnobius sp. AArcel1 TaxID=1679093 RepID=UPI0013ECA21F|nr:hypothetical protein [Natronolimnobius sp. AArcel1]NGM69196.1 hypothetical protein [Natronolimnobius sp. AArcel1]